LVHGVSFEAHLEDPCSSLHSFLVYLAGEGSIFLFQS
jgi:hypothetical protein